MPDIFLSYSRQDAPFAQRLQQALTQVGYAVWIDTQDLLGGNPWRADIAAAIEAAPQFLLLLSPASVQSAHVRRELDLADTLKKTIVPVQIQPAQIPAGWRYQLAGLQLEDLAADFEAGLPLLLTRLQDAGTGAREPADLLAAAEQRRAWVDASRHEIFRWLGHEFVVRSALRGRYLWFATDTDLYLDGELLLRVGGMRRVAHGVIKRELNGRQVELDFTARTGTPQGQFYMLKANGVEVRRGLVPIANRLVSYLRNLVVLVLFILLLSEIMAMLALRLPKF